MELAKAYLCEVDNPGSRVTFHFNPTTIKFSKSANFRREPAQAAADAPPVQFQGTAPTELNLDLLLDAVGKPGGSVTPEVDQLLRWTGPTAESAGTPSPSPPKLQFNWGRLKLGTSDKFEGHLERVNVTYVLFNRDGTPIRAEVGLSLKAAPTEQPGTNPTSGGRRAHRAHQLTRGETLQSLAHQVYGNAAYWRGIAAANGIDDPMRVAPGRRLLIPDLADLVEGR
jgi:nucleoid-associated protein YgaU